MSKLRRPFFHLVPEDEMIFYIRTGHLGGSRSSCVSLKTEPGPHFDSDMKRSASGPYAVWAVCHLVVGAAGYTPGVVAPATALPLQLWRRDLASATR